jgi:hypothetical protein
MEGYRFKVFGTPIVVERVGGGWQAFYPGADGKWRAADFVIPSDIAEHELGEYLADLFHENARPRNSTVERLA